jgi:hypothetical protein
MSIRSKKCIFDNSRLKMCSIVSRSSAINPYLAIRIVRPPMWASTLSYRIFATKRLIEFFVLVVLISDSL